MKLNKAQAWGADLTVALMIFLIGIVLFFFYSINYPNEGEQNLNLLISDGNILADSLLSNGYPEDWNSETVQKIGITNNNKINETKLEKFYNLANSDYTQTKQLFNTKYDYYFFLSEIITLPEGDVQGIGKSGTNPESIDAQNLIKITRFTIYQEKPATAYFYVWEE